jgi:sec-independent protein translocase protein TatA
MQVQPLVLILGPLGIQEILIVLLILVLLFGGRKIPELARGLGRGITEFKRGIHEPPKQSKPELPDKAESADSEAAKDA